MFTVITKGNDVRQYHGIEYLYEVRKTENDYMIVNDIGEVEVYVGNPITWPTDAKNGMQAIVDVKAGTLRFGMNNGPLSLDELVVSEYVAPVKKGLHSETIVVEWPEDAPAGLRLVHNLVTLTSKFESPSYELKENEIVAAVKGMDFIPFVSAEDSTPVIGTKHDQGKPILGAVPPHAELAVGRVLTFGAEKYARGNWDKVEDHENRYMDAALRHLNAHRRGELTDSESGESHLAHAACCILFMLDKQERSC